MSELVKNELKKIKFSLLKLTILFVVLIIGVPYISNNGFHWAFYLFLSLYILPMQHAALIVKVPNSQAKVIWKNPLANGSELVFAKFFVSLVHYFIAAVLIVTGLIVTFYISPESEAYLSSTLPFLYQVHYFLVIFLSLLFYAPAAFVASLYALLKGLNEQWTNLLFILIVGIVMVISVFATYTFPLLLIIIVGVLVIASILLKRLLSNLEDA
ncbi:hypothetical protein [Bacillus sp. es.036]|uniref:hypothetical protein n=1 Tax=Bacillus sp. es.036 TaxID=1761764 RepID=UPI000BF81D71|nr:hypothetical protein [Bacillus sp. es.036]PFG14670.1 hypothetical protein ATG70_2906 [Bacillus sp. es.036]